VIERDGVSVLVDPISWDFVAGATVDYSSEMMRSAFVVATNPNAASRCSCGSSFDAKKNTNTKKS
jgi:iron-sulfur cluster insertion protein